MTNLSREDGTGWKLRLVLDVIRASRGVCLWNDDQGFENEVGGEPTWWEGLAGMSRLEGSASTVRFVGIFIALGFSMKHTFVITSIGAT